MKICLVNSFYPPYIGGAETYVSNLARNLTAIGHEVTVYCGDKPLTAGETYESGVRIVRMRIPFTFYGTPLAWFPKSWAAEKYDIIHCNFPNPYFSAISGIVGKARGVPSVLTWHNDLPPVTGAASLLVHANTVFSVAYLAPYSRIIATTEVYARKSKVLRGQSRKVAVIPNGVDTERFSPCIDPRSVKERHHLDGYTTLLFVGALTTWHTYKGLEELLHAFAMVKRNCERLKLLVVGSGNLLGRYRNVAQNLGCSDNVIFAGRVAEEDLPSYYSASDLAVLPSRDASEGFGLTLLEAMATGKAVIGSSVGGIPDVIDDGRNGLLVPPKDSTRLADAIRALCVNDDVRERMGRFGRKFAESRDWRMSAKRVESLYKEVGH